MQLTNSPADIIDRVYAYQDAVADSKALASLMSSARAWYAYRTDEGTHIFAPSKFIGYANLTANDYLELKSEALDGRTTERHLREVLEDRTDSNATDRLITELRSFTGKFGKSPSKLARISLIAREGEEKGESSASDRIVDLILAQFAILTSDEKRRVKAAL